MWFMVCRCPRSQKGDWARPHLCKLARHGPACTGVLPNHLPVTVDSDRHKPHCRHVPISKTWRQTESTPRSGLRRSHKEQLVRTRDNLESRRTCRDAVQVRTVTALNCQSQLGQSHQPIPRLPPTHTTWPAPRDTPVQQVTWYQLGRGHQPVPCHPPTHITWPAPTYTPVQQLIYDLSFTCMLQAYLEQDKMLCYCIKSTVQCIMVRVQIRDRCESVPESDLDLDANSDLDFAPSWIPWPDLILDTDLDYVFHLNPDLDMNNGSGLRQWPRPGHRLQHGLRSGLTFGHGFRTKLKI